MTTRAAYAIEEGQDWYLSDGSRLVNPRELGPSELTLNSWVVVDGRVRRITNLRSVGTGRLVDLCRHSRVYVRGGETLTAYEVLAPTDDPPPARGSVAPLPDAAGAPKSSSP